MNTPSEEIVDRLALSTIAVGLANLTVRTNIGDSNIDIQEKRLNSLKNTKLTNYSKNSNVTLFDVVEDYQLVLTSLKANIREKFIASAAMKNTSIEEESSKLFNFFDAIRKDDEPERYSGQKSVAEFLTKTNEYTKESLNDWIIKMVNEQKNKNQYHSELNNIKANMLSMRKSLSSQNINDTNKPKP